MAQANPSIPPKRPRGRPKGSKTKKTLQEAINRFESNQLASAQVIIDTMMGNSEALGVEAVTLKERVAAAKYIITAPSTMRKGFQDTKETVDGVDEDEDDVVTEETKNNVFELVSTTIVDPYELKRMQEEKEALEAQE